MIKKLIKNLFSKAETIAEEKASLAEQNANNYTDELRDDCSFTGTHKVLLTFNGLADGGLYHASIQLPLTDLYRYDSVTLISIDNMVGAASPNISKNDVTARILNDYCLDCYTSKSSAHNNTYFCTLSFATTYIGG